MQHVGYGVVMYSGHIDYVRITMKGDGRDEDKMAVYRKIARATMALATEGEVEEQPWRFAGYSGQACASVAYGVSSQGYILQASGPAADACISFDPPWDNVARIDYAYTMWIPSPKGDFSRVLAELSAGAATIAHGGRWKTAHIEGFGGGNTTYIGSRTSDSYIRCYDKGSESSEDEAYRYAWRVEIEAKGALAPALWPCKSPASVSDAYCAGVVVARARDRGIPLAYPSQDARIAKATVYKPVTTNESRLAWLRHQVAPSVGRLLASGVSRETVMQALGLE